MCLKLTLQIVCLFALVIGQSANASPHLCQSSPQQALSESTHVMDHGMSHDINHDGMDHSSAMNDADCCVDCQCDISSCQTPLAWLANPQNIPFDLLDPQPLSHSIWHPNPSLDTPFKPPSFS